MSDWACVRVVNVSASALLAMTMGASIEVTVLFILDILLMMAEKSGSLSDLTATDWMLC